MSELLRQRLLFSFLMSGMMAFLMTAWVTLLNLGFSASYVQNWMRAFFSAWPPAFVIVLLSAPSVQRLTRFLLNRFPAKGGEKAEGEGPQQR